MDLREQTMTKRWVKEEWRETNEGVGQRKKERKLLENILEYIMWMKKRFCDRQRENTWIADLWDKDVRIPFYMIPPRIVK